jgi:hypothetical protein
MDLLLDARRVLLAGLLAPTTQTIEEFAAATIHDADTKWVVGSVAIPSSQLEALATHLMANLLSGQEQLRISAVIDEPLGSAVMRAAAFDKIMSPAATIVALEAPHSTGIDDAALRVAATGIGPQVAPFISRDLPPEGSGATGVILPLSGVFEAEAVTDQLRLACRRRIPLKAYVSGSVWTAAGTVGDLGVMNLLAASALVCDQGDDNATAALTDTHAEHFELSRAGLRWKDQFIGIPSLRLARSLLVACGIPDPTTTLAGLETAELLP